MYLFQAGVPFSTENAKGTAFRKVYSENKNPNMYIFCDEKYTKYTKQKLSTPTKILETPNRHQVRKTKHQVRKTKHQIRQTKYQLRQTKHKVPQTKHKVRQPKYQVRQTKHQVHQVCNLIKKQMLICIPKY